MTEKHGVERFTDEAEALGYAPRRLGPNEVAFDYLIENGPRVGDTVELGFVVPENWPTEPPHGPCYRPAILRGQVQGAHPGHSIGPDWDHWSRPHNAWALVPHTLESYMRHVRRLNAELPPPEEQADAA